MDCLFLCNAMDIYSSKSVRLRNYPFFFDTEIERKLFCTYPQESFLAYRMSLNL